MTVMLERYKYFQNRVAKAAQELESSAAHLKCIERDLRARVQMFVVGKTVTLVFEGRTLKCVKNSHNRYRVTENKKVISSDYLGSIRDLQLQFATGEMV